MDTDYSFGPAVGFPMSADNWREVVDTLGPQLDFGEVTQIKALHSEHDERAVPVLTRLLGDDSGAAITCGYEDIRFGFIPTDTAIPTFVRTGCEDEVAQVATCFFGKGGLMELNPYELPDSGPADGLIEDCVVEVEYVPLNPGGHLYAPDCDEMECRYGYLQLTGLFDDSSCTVTLSDDGDYDFALNFLTSLKDVDSPVNDVACVIRSSERKINETTGIPFWHLEVEFEDSHVVNCCAPDPLDSLFSDSGNPYPIGSVVSGVLMFTGRFVAFHWGGSLQESELSSPMVIDGELLSVDDPLQGGLAALNSVSCFKRHWDFARDFSRGGVNSDIAGCLGFNYREFRQQLGQFLFKRADKMWASHNELVFDTASNTAVVDAEATMTQISSIETMGPGASCVIGMSLPGNFWGCAVMIDSEVSEIERVYAGVDINLVASQDEVLDELLDPVEDLWDLAYGTYGESRIAAVRAEYPRLHQNSFTGGFFISVTARLTEGDATIVLPCPDWLERIAARHGTQSLETAQALQLLHGRYLVGRFDDCTLSANDSGSFLEEFDSEMRVRTPEPYYIRRAQRDRWHISKCYRNPEINLNAAAVAKLDQVGKIPMAELMTLLQAGPVSLGFRLSEIYDSLGINIYYVGGGNFRIERSSGEAEWAVRLESSDEFELDEDDENLTLFDLDEFFDSPASSNDPSIGDYLTEDDNLDNHLLLLEQAILKNQKVSILYGDRSDEPTVRTIRPVRIVSLNHLYLVAWDELREAWRTFRVQRVKMCSLLDDHFPPIEMPLPAEMTEKELKYLREKLGENADVATLFVAWTIWFRI